MTGTKKTIVTFKHGGYFYSTTEAEDRARNAFVALYPNATPSEVRIERIEEAQSPENDGRNLFAIVSVKGEVNVEKVLTPEEAVDSLKAEIEKQDRAISNIIGCLGKLNKKIEDISNTKTNHNDTKEGRLQELLDRDYSWSSFSLEEMAVIEEKGRSEEVLRGIYKNRLIEKLLSF